DRRRPSRARLPRISTRRLLLAALPLWIAPLPAQAALELAAGRLAFRDPRLDAHYGPAPILGLRLGLTSWRSLEPALSARCAWDRRQLEAAPFIAGAETRIILLPLTLELPVGLRIAPRWRLSAGPALGGLWCRERWRAAVPAAGLNASRQGTDIWFAAGLLAEVRHELGRAGVLAAGGEILWVDAQRRAIGTNPAQAEPLDAGWIALRLGWTPRPARAAP
ncbi:MAG: hypothetical protein FJY75_11965, partial [Candidatus Eisenbacteria bacterium]|nr:hypothetical protein [Candidatus Eisenbacteria bacterium]